jgi:hypothetical protein
MAGADPIAEYLASGGQIERCPTVCLVLTTGRPPAADRQQLAERHEAREAERDRLRAERWRWPAMAFVEHSSPKPPDTLTHK